MKTVVFECSENRNHYREEFEVDDDTTDEEIEKEFVDWVWNEVGDHYSWYMKDGDKDG